MWNVCFCCTEFSFLALCPDAVASCTVMMIHFSLGCLQGCMSLWLGAHFQSSINLNLVIGCSLPHFNQHQAGPLIFFFTDVFINLLAQSSKSSLKLHLCVPACSFLDPFYGLLCHFVTFSFVKLLFESYCTVLQGQRLHFKLSKWIMTSCIIHQHSLNFANHS